MKIIEGGCYHLGGGRRSPVVSRVAMVVIWIVFVILALGASCVLELNGGAYPSVSPPDHDDWQS